MSLKKYQIKRHFEKTSEPKGNSEFRIPAYRQGRQNSELPIFVVQEHHASHLHYDFRLEVNGELVSFAVPKGFPKTPAERHLAVHVENHPLEYAKFEGVIPKDEYGAGTVKIWDHGTYKPVSPMEKMIKEGKIVFELMGRKLKGKWSLIRFTPLDMKLSNGVKGSEKNWLLIKQKTGA